MTSVVAFTAAMLAAIGTYLVLQRKLSRIIIGVGLLGHSANLLLVSSGRPGAAALIGSAPTDTFSDPLAQALVLTAIVITFGATAFLLALAYRAWLLSADDEVVDDVEDRTVAAGGIIDREVTDEEEQARDVEKDTDAEAEEQQPA